MTEIQVEDPLGNVTRPQECWLCTEVPAWKLAVNLARKKTVHFAPSEVWAISGLAVPSQSRTRRISRAYTRQGVRFEILAVGGPGQTTHKDLAPERLGVFEMADGGLLADGSETAASGQDPAEYGITTKTNVSGSTTTVEADWPYLVVRLHGLDEVRRPIGRRLAGVHKLMLRVTDEQGRQVAVKRGDDPDNRSDVEYWFFDVPPGSRVDLKAIVEECRTVEFLVEPPAGASRQGADTATTQQDGHPETK